MLKEKVDGIILVLSCQKHINTRLKLCSLKEKYTEWKVVYVIGDLFLTSEYTINKNLLIIKCEDSYIHLFKKLILALKYVYKIFDVKEGILRCGDDLIFNEKILTEFLSINAKSDFIGACYHHISLDPKDITPQLLKSVCIDNFMIDYYSTHSEDFQNPQHGLKGIDLSKYIKRPFMFNFHVFGVVYYISNTSCKILIEHMEKINFNIFHLDQDTNSFPYTIEDCASSFILFKNRIGLVHEPHMYSDSITDADKVLAVHTNLYK